MKTIQFLLQTLLLIVGLTCAIVAMFDTFNEQTIWSDMIKHPYLMNGLMFISGMTTSLISFKNFRKQL